MVDFGRRAGPAYHAARHEDGGVDEISVDSLLGDLFDDQSPSAHDLAGSDHNADTLADLNTKVSDATLDTSSATRTPAAHKDSHKSGGSDEIDVTGLTSAAHKTSHQDGQADEIAATGLVGRINLVDRGDPSAYDWTEATLTTDGNYNDLDLSSIIDAGSIAVLLKMRLRHSSTTWTVRFRNNGNTYELATPGLATQVANQFLETTFIVFCDASRKIEYKATSGTWDDIDLLVLGWFV